MPITNETGYVSSLESLEKTEKEIKALRVKQGKIEQDIFDYLYTAQYKRDRRITTINEASVICGEEMKTFKSLGREKP
jgi:hypothetical protein